MKELIQELIQEKGRELVFITGVVIVVLALAFGYLYFMGEDDPLLPNGFLSTRSSINKNISDSFLITNKVTQNLNDLLELDAEDDKTEILANIGKYRGSLLEIQPTVEKMANGIEKISSMISEVRPKRAQEILSDALTNTAILGQTLLSFQQKMNVLYDGLEAKARGEEFAGDYTKLVNEVNDQVRDINSLYDSYQATMEEFNQLTND